MATVHLTDALVRGLPVPAKGYTITWDSEVPGFGVRVTASGIKAFIFNYRTKLGRERRPTIGRWPTWSVGSARIESRRLQRLVDQGEDPRGDLVAEREAPTVAKLIERFELEHLSRRKPSTRRAYGFLIAHIHLALGNLKVNEVDFADIDGLHRKVTNTAGPYAANRTIAVASKMFSLAVRWGMRADNPAKGIERNTESPRTRYLIGDELLRLTKALAAHPSQQAANVVRLMLLTGCRSGEALAARWADIDLTGGIWSKPAASVKQERAHIVPLSAPARQLLSEIQAEQKAGRRALGEYVFPGKSASGHFRELKGPWRRLCRDAGITGLRPHDLRHSFASELVNVGASLPLIGALLGHSNPQTTSRYAHMYSDPLRAAAERVGATVIAAAGAPAHTGEIGKHTREVGKPSKGEVIPIKGGRRGRR